jgi:hypothetical protein
MFTKDKQTGRNSLLAALTATLFMLAFASSGVAQHSLAEVNHATKVTFSKPVEIPGVGVKVLPAGTYIFRLLNSVADRNIVQIFSEDEKHVYATILAIPNHRLQPTDKTVITFAERPAGSPPALAAWFYPYETWGQEFVYPKARATELAKATNEPFIYMPTELIPEIIAPVKTATEPSAVALERAPLRVVTPQGQDQPVASVVERPSPQAVAEARAAERAQTPVLTASLPRTASALPLLAAAGVLLLGAGFALKLFRVPASKR